MNGNERDKYKWMKWENDCEGKGWKKNCNERKMHI